MTGPVAFFDSGIGGLPYLASTKALLPNRHFVYLADSLRFPYGEKTKAEVIDATLTSVELIMRSLKPEILVIACNTASIASLEALRERYAIPIVGTVPAVKSASKYSKNRSIGILATERTIKDAYVSDLIEKFASDCAVYKRAAPELVRYVETELFDYKEERFKEVMHDSLAYFAQNKVDTIVLACTHFSHVMNEIASLVGPAVQVIDSRSGIANRVLDLLNKRDAEVGESPVNLAELNPLRKESSLLLEDSFYVTGQSNLSMYEHFASRFKLSFKGVIE